MVISKSREIKERRHKISKIICPELVENSLNKDSYKIKTMIICTVNRNLKSNINDQRPYIYTLNINK